MQSRALACFWLLFLPLLLPAQVYKCDFGSSSPRIRITLQSVVFHTPVPLPAAAERSIRQQLFHLAQAVHSTDQEAALGNAAEDIVREEYLNRGYFRTSVEAELQTAADHGNVRTVELIFSIHPGKRYRMGDISWRGNSAISTQELAATMSVRRGEIFERQKIAAGLEKVRELYRSRGYVNFVSVPVPRIDEQRQIVSFDIDIDEGRQFLFGDLNLTGIEPKYSQMLLSAWSQLRGQPCNPKTADAFFRHYFTPFRSDVKPSDYVRFRINERTARVDYSLSLTRNRSLDSMIPRKLAGM
jgi:outer membrane translocation and assembly module TamA